MISGRPGHVKSRRSPGIDSEKGYGKRRMIATAIFGIGVLIGMVMLGVSVYPDFESRISDVFLVASTNPRLIDCPILLSADESSVVSTTLTNRNKVPLERLVLVHISRGHLTLLREIEQQVDLAPGEKLGLEWEVTSKDAAYGHLIFAKIMVSLDNRNPLQRGSCGILVLDLPFGIKGSTVVTAMYLLSFVCIISAAVLWWSIGRTYSGIRLEATRAMFIMGAVVLIGLIFALLGWWWAAAGAFLLAFLSIGVVVPHFLMNIFRKRKLDIGK